MTRQLLFDILLWLRKIVLYGVMIVIAVGLILYFTVNSPLVIKKLADTFSPDYNITYSRIHGNFITGVEIEDLQYNDKSLVQQLTLRWNPNGLFQKKILINKLKFEKVNINGIKSFISSFENNDENETSEDFDFSVIISSMAMTVEPFVEQNIRFNYIGLKAKDVAYSSDEIFLSSVHLNLDSNISEVDLKASLDKRNIHIHAFDVKALDTRQVERLLLQEDTFGESEVQTGKEGSSTTVLLPKTVSFDRLSFKILPRTFEAIDIKDMTLQATRGKLDIETLILQHTDISLQGDTNLSDIEYYAKMVDNRLSGIVKLTPKEALFKAYALPLRQESIKTLEVALDVSQEQIDATLDTQLTQFLDLPDNAFNMDVKHLRSLAHYDIDKGSLDVETHATIETPYTKKLTLYNHFQSDHNISYEGMVQIKKITGVDPKFTESLNDLNITYSGDGKGIEAIINAQNIKGVLNAEDYKKGLLYLETPKEVDVAKLLSLPDELNQTKANVILEVPLYFESNSSLAANAKIDSNLVNIDANITFRDFLDISSIVDIPKDSLLRHYSEALIWDALSPVSLHTKLQNEVWDIVAKSDTFVIDTKYNVENEHVDGTVVFDGLKTEISGKVNEKLQLQSDITDISSFTKSIQDIYVLKDVPQMKGSAKVDLQIDHFKEANLTMRSPAIIYMPDAQTEHYVQEIDLQVSMSKSEILLDHYSFIFEEQKVFATKPSKISIQGDTIRLEGLWVNDDLKIDGNYTLNTKQGSIITNADAFPISHKFIDLKSDIDIKTVFDGNKTSIQGKVVILGGDIKYDISQKKFESDSDIIIVQEIKEKEQSTFMEGLSTEIQVETQKPLVYHKENISIKASADLGIHKVESSELMVLGTVKLHKGGSYTFERKKFILDESFVHFTGNPNNPLLEITVNYKSMNHLITILITGSADMPNINFSSKPSLTKEQILSIILFDSEAAAGTNNGNDMMKMMGGAMAKSALNDLGVQIDHLVLGAGNSVEVGKKLTEDITIIYVNDVVSKVKLKYEHSKSTESVFSASEESQSYDIIYKKDF